MLTTHNAHTRLPKASCWFQAKTMQTTIRGMVGFNGPRAGICFNDGFGGGNVLEDNVMWSWTRESSDHGVFNSWDRQMYVPPVRTTIPTVSRATVVWCPSPLWPLYFVIGHTSCDTISASATRNNKDNESGKLRLKSGLNASCKPTRTATALIFGAVSFVRGVYVRIICLCSDNLFLTKQVRAVSQSGKDDSHWYYHCSIMFSSACVL
jgi:hypothetical protein